MTRALLRGMKGSNPLGFMASVGLLRILDSHPGADARLGFTEDGEFHACLESTADLDLAGLVSTDAASAAGAQPWRLHYEKAEKSGTKIVSDLKAPPESFSRFLRLAVEEWLEGRPERADYAAAYATDVAMDGKQNTKPTALHFTAANQQFLGAVEQVRHVVTKDWVKRALEIPGQARPGQNLRWDPDAERSRALMGANPNVDGTVVNAPLEWLAFRGLPAFPCVPIGNRIVTCGVTGRRQQELEFHWPLWSQRATYATVRSLLPLAASWHERQDSVRVRQERQERGIFAVCTSEIRRTAQGFGNFGPALVRV